MAQKGKFESPRSVQRRRRRRRRRIRSCLSFLMFLALAAAVGLGTWKLYDKVIGSKGENTLQPVPSLEPSASSVPSETEPAATDSAPETTQDTEPTEEPTEVPTDPSTPSYAEQLLDSMTLEQKVYQLFVVVPEDLCGGSGLTAIPENMAEILERKPVGGIIFFASNLRNRSQTIQMIEDLQNASSLPLFISVDEEGGPVSRIGSNPNMEAHDFPAMASIETAEEARNVGETIGADLIGLGFNLDFAPVADVFTNPNNRVIGSRAFSSDPDTAALLVSACVEGFSESGVISCLKHFPGHGDTAQDSHYGYASSEKAMDALLEEEFVPFRAGIEAGCPMVMVGHISLPNVPESDGEPASLSPFWIQEILRQELGFDGLVITDSLSMGAVTQAYPQKGQGSLKAFLAGADLLLMPDSLTASAAAICQAVEDGTITEERINESVLRILRMKEAYGILPVLAEQE